VYWTTMPTMGAGDQGPIPQRKPERQLSWPRLAAGTKTIQWRGAEMVNGPSRGCPEKERLLKWARKQSALNSGASRRGNTRAASPPDCYCD